MRHTRVVVPHYGGPEVITVIEEDIPTPNAGEVRVKVLAAGVSLPGDQVTVNGLPAQVTIDHVEPTLDTLVLQGDAGDDIIDASGMPAAVMQFIVNGGDGNDVLHGGQGNDLLNGGSGADRFEFSGVNGTDTIVDFQQGLDKIDITGYGGALNKFGDLAGHISQVGADTHVDLGGAVAGAGIIVLQNTQMASLSSSDFAFK